MKTPMWNCDLKANTVQQHHCGRAGILKHRSRQSRKLPIIPVTPTRRLFGTCLVSGPPRIRSCLSLEVQAEVVLVDVLGSHGVDEPAPHSQRPPVEHPERGLLVQLQLLVQEVTKNMRKGVCKCCIGGRNHVLLTSPIFFILCSGSWVIARQDLFFQVYQRKKGSPLRGQTRPHMNTN